MLPIILTCFIVLLADILWLHLMKPLYNNTIATIQKTPLVVNYYGAIISYILLLIGVFSFSIPLVKNKINNSKKISLVYILSLSLTYGASLGLIVYGVFNATNIAIFKNYSIKTAFLDTLWGCFLFTLATFTYFLSSRF